MSSFRLCVPSSFCSLNFQVERFAVELRNLRNNYLDRELHLSFIHLQKFCRKMFRPAHFLSWVMLGFIIFGLPNVTSAEENNTSSGNSSSTPVPVMASSVADHPTTTPNSTLFSQIPETLVKIAAGLNNSEATSTKINTNETSSTTETNSIQIDLFILGVANYSNNSEIEHIIATNTTTKVTQPKTTEKNVSLSIFFATLIISFKQPINSTLISSIEMVEPGHKNRISIPIVRKNASSLVGIPMRFWNSVTETVKINSTDDAIFENNQPSVNESSRDVFGGNTTKARNKLIFRNSNQTDKGTVTLVKNSKQQNSKESMTKILLFLLLTLVVIALCCVTYKKCSGNNRELYRIQLAVTWSNFRSWFRNIREHGIIPQRRDRSGRFGSNPANTGLLNNDYELL